MQYKFRFYIFWTILTFACNLSAQVYEGSFMLQSQAEVDAAVQVLNDGNYDEVSGLLWIGKQPFTNPAIIWDLSGFSMLRKIGALWVISTDSLKNLSGFENVDSIGNTQLFIQNNNDLEDISALKNANFYRLGGGVDHNVGIEDNPKLLTLVGLEGISGVGWQFRIARNLMLTDIRGLKNLNFVGDLLYLNKFMGSDLNGIENAGGRFRFSMIDCPNLMDITATQAWDSLSTIAIADCPQLGDISPLDEIVLFDPAQSLSLEGKNVAALTIGDCELIAAVPKIRYKDQEAGQIVLFDNPSLVDISELHALTEIRSFDLYNCDALANFEMPNWELAGSLYIENNDALVNFTFPPFKEIAILNTINIEILDNLLLEEIAASNDLPYANQVLIEGNAGLTAITGFNGLDSLKWGVTIMHNAQLKTFDAFNNITHIGVDNNQSIGVKFFNNPIDTIIGFSNLETIDGGLGIAGSAFQHLPPFPKLRVVTQNLGVTNTEDLIEVKGFANLEKVRTINISSNKALITIDAFEKLDSLFSDFSALDIIDNENLKEIIGFNNISFFPGKIRLWSNPTLEIAPAFCNMNNSLGYWPSFDIMESPAPFNNVGNIANYCTTVGVPSLTTQQLKFYPNPFTERIVVEGLENNTQYELIDSNGKRVQQGLLPSNGAIPIDDPMVGIFILRIIDDQQSIIYQERLVGMMD